MKKGLVMVLIAKFPQHTLVIHEFNGKTLTNKPVNLYFIKVYSSTMSF